LDRLREALFPSLERSKPLGERLRDPFLTVSATSDSFERLRDSFLPLRAAVGVGEADFFASPLTASATTLSGSFCSDLERDRGMVFRGLVVSEKKKLEFFTALAIRSSIGTVGT
jgi:hypothetical protein